MTLDSLVATLRMASTEKVGFSKSARLISSVGDVEEDIHISWSDIVNGLVPYHCPKLGRKILELRKCGSH